MRTCAQKEKPSQQTASVSATKNGRAFLGQNRAVRSILHLQRTIGNRAVQRLLDGTTEESEVGASTVVSAPSVRNFKRMPSHGKAHAGVQPKLTVSSPGDIYEQEADRVAEWVVGMAEPKLQRTRVCGEGCPECQAGQPGQKHEVLETKRAQPNGAAESEVPPIVHEVLRSPGRPLASATLAYFEPRFRHDFRHVRVHTDTRAFESARAVNALAYTVGQDVVFGAGQFRPWNDKGRRLLAHELAHTIQQGSGKRDRLARVPTESGIRETPPRYNFSTNCGWIDWSHASPAIGTDLINRVRQASNALREAGTSASASTGDFTSTTMASRVPGVGFVLSSAALQVRLLRPLSDDEILSAALSIFKRLSIVFETQQRWTQLVGRSSFSQEDLPSNLIGFYQAARGYTRDRVNQFCGTLDESGSLQEYNRDHDFEENRSFAPVGITGQWPSELSTIDDSQAHALYEIRTIAATQGTTSFRFCPLYRVEGRIGETDLFVVSVGGTRFTAADNLRVVPTYRAREGTSGHYGHVKFIEVEPNGQADFHMFRQHDIAWPIYVPEPVLVCLSSHGNPV